MMALSKGAAASVSTRDENYIKDLFDFVISRYDPTVNYSGIRNAIRNMSITYNSGSNLSQELVTILDYDNAAYQYAYLHRYAPFYTDMVLNLMNEALNEEKNAGEPRWLLSFRAINDNFWIGWMSYFQTVKICSLGGGPGTDVIGVLMAFYLKFGLQKCSSTLIDVKSGWKNVFDTALKAMRSDSFSNSFKNMASDFFDWNFIVANLMDDEMNTSTRDAIRSANFITMVKFVSSSACNKTIGFIKKMFNLLRPGSLVLYIDNAGGDFAEKVFTAASECNMRSVYGPIWDMKYVNELFKATRYGYDSCSVTKVSAVLLMKNGNGINELPFTRFLGPPAHLDYSSNVGVLYYSGKKLELPLRIR